MLQVQIPKPGDLVFIIVGDVSDTYGILICPTQNRLRLDDAFLLEPAWSVITQYGVVVIDNTDFIVIEND